MSMQLDLFGSGLVDEGRAPPLLAGGAGEHWQRAETAALVAALRRGALNDALVVVRRLKPALAIEVLMEAGFTVGAGQTMDLVLAPAQKDLVDAARRGMSGRELKAFRERIAGELAAGERQGGGSVGGESVIDAIAASGNANSDASLERSRAREEVTFSVPYVGPTGAALVGYSWAHRLEAVVDARGEDQVRAVSDWEAAVVNLETGREIVHQFVVRSAGQDEQSVSAESAARLLGIGDQAVRTQAKRLLEEEIRRAKT